MQLFNGDSPIVHCQVKLRAVVSAGVMDDHSWKFFTCPTDFDCLVNLLQEKSEEFDIKGHMICVNDDIVRGKAPSHNKVESRNQEVSEPGMSISNY